MRQGVSFIQDGPQAVEIVKPRTPGYAFLPLAISLLLAALGCSQLLLLYVLLDDTAVLVKSALNIHAEVALVCKFRPDGILWLAEWCI